MPGTPPDLARRHSRAPRALHALHALGILGGAVLFISFWWPAAWTGEGAPHAAGAAVAVLIAEISWPLMLLASAVGFGWALRAWLLPRARDALAVELGLGIAGLLVLDALLARIGVLTAEGGAGAWVVVAAGLALVVLRYRRQGGPDDAAGVGTVGAAQPEAAGRMLLWAAAPAAALLLLAACSAPGWLWATEFGGYDVLSYHLQLPKEWRTLGRLEGLDHNVYSFLPSYVEGAYLHLSSLRRAEALYASQILHAAMTVLTAVMAGRLGRRAGGPFIGALAAGLVLGTPWVIVVGTLAYNEMAVTMMLACGLLILEDEHDGAPWRLGAAIGLLAGAACGAKLTSVGFVALPLGALLLFTAGSWRRRAAACVAALVAGVLALAPWLVANAIDTGNPVFPFATSIFGTGHWTADQAAIWAGGHRAEGSLAERLVAGWNEFLRFGLGPAPADSGPWRPQWSILPWLALAGAAISLAIRSRRRTARRLVLVIGLQLAFWLALTHVKSRFMVPAVVPMALLVALGGVAVRERLNASWARRGAAAVVVTAGLLAYCLLPTVLFRTEANSMPAAAVGAAAVFSGDAHAARLKQPGLSEAERRALLSNGPPMFWINHAIEPDARVLSVGDAAPLYSLRDNLVYQTTWDRGPMSRAMRAGGEDPAAWIRSLRDDGFTHLLVNPVMLSIWEQEGWNDPLITARRVIGAAETHASIEFRRDNIALYRLSD